MKDLKYKKLLTYLLTLIISISVSIIHDVPVRADVDIQLFEYILTLYANMGVGITDSSVLTAMQTHLGSGIAVGTDAIATAIAACEQAMGTNMITSTFASTAESTASYVAEVGASNLAGAATATATAAENIGASIANYQSFGFVAPVQGGTSLLATAGMGALAVAAGVAAGFALNKFREFLVPYINYGLGIGYGNISGTYGLAAYKWDSYNPGYSPYFYANGNNSNYIIGNDPSEGCVWIVNNSGSSYAFTYFRNNKTNAGRTWVDAHSYVKIYGQGTNPKGLTVWGGVMGKPEDYLGKPMPPMVSPDIITGYGNVTSSQPIEAPDKESTPYLEPIPWEVYEPWADAARERTKNGETGQDQGDGFQELTDPYWKPQTDADGIPQGSLTTPAPVYPAQPTYMPMATEAPNPNPTTNPQVEPAPTLTPEEITQTLEDKTIRNLGSIFPFCIPFDIVDLFRKMDVARKAPVLTWDTDFGQWGSFGTISLDMSMFDQAAAVARTFELILFIMGLMVGTKNLIGWGG